MVNLRALLSSSFALVALFSSTNAAYSPGSSSHDAQDDFRLTDVQGQTHMVFTHESFADHRIRIKETTGWCDPYVKSYTGYLDVDSHGRNLFFYFFLSKSNPEKDDVLMWINGGPGCGSETGLFQELGPCKIVDSSSLNGTEVNPYAWNSNLNVFLLDQPIGVGLSYGSNGQVVSNTEQAAIDVQAFIAIFFDTFKEFRGRRFHLSGESYGGRYLPLFGAAVVDGNKNLKHPINLQSVIIGNGVTDRFDLTLTHYNMTCTSLSGLSPVLSVSECAQMQATLPRCKEMMKEYCEDVSDPLGCQNAISFCYKWIKNPFAATGLNPYDMSKPCIGSGCYGPIKDAISSYLDNPAHRSFLGIDPHVGNFTGCDSKVGMDFAQSGDHTGKTWFYVASLLEHGIKFLIYAGKYDFQCNFIHQIQWTSRLEWTHSVGFNEQPIVPWYMNQSDSIDEDRSVGEWRTYGGLTYVSIKGAGHMVPYDKPAESLEMLTRFLEHEKM
ncbi:Serine carboxypeptidases (lysosomal cathepsin A) [Phaffia rhodozyma]|uniref:Carboxypeptidase n=1 Tax=Phaffia rhodozyma TaxID=264483 RepID=A0A0F7SQ15_PHARH|nr:Serine carboxypeptidases (lysosomal cathepsin A) [Phaffia rhodozyma]